MCKKNCTENVYRYNNKMFLPDMCISIPNAVTYDIMHVAKSYLTFGSNKKWMYNNILIVYVMALLY